MEEVVKVTYLPTLSAQTQYFLYSLVLGLLIGAVYDFMRAIRISVYYGRKAKFYFSDVLIFVFTAFVFELYTISFGYGKIRYYAILGMLLGFIFYINTIGSVTLKIETVNSKVTHKILLFFIVKPIFILYNDLVVVLNRIFHRKKGDGSEEEGAKEQ